MPGSRISWTERSWVFGGVPVLVLALACAALGVMPHLFASYQMAPGTYFQGAYDESFYLLSLFGEIPDWNDYPLKQALAALIHAVQPSLAMTALVLDAFFPFAIVLAAGVLARQIALSRTQLEVRRHVQPQAGTVLLAFALVFGSDFLSLNSTVSLWPNTHLSKWATQMSLEHRQYIVDALASYLKPYRTPEPQLSLSVFLLHLAALVSFLARPLNLRTTVLPLLVTSLLCAAIYSFFSLSALAFTAAGCVAMILSRQRRGLWGLALAFLLGLAATGYVLVRYYSNEADASIFASRLPIVSPGMLYSVAGLIWVLLRKRGLAWSGPVPAFSLLLLAFAPLVLNQQVITGIMVQSLNWERYVIIPVVVSGLALAFVTPTQPATTSKPFSTKLGLVGVLVLCTGFVLQAQIRTYRQWLPYNVTTQTLAQALDDAIATQGLEPFDTVIFDSMQMDAAVLARSDSNVGERIKGYTWIVTRAFGTDQNKETASVLAAQAYEVAARLGLDAKGYRSALEAELNGNYCWPHLMYLSDFLQCAPYVSDFRLYDPDALRQVIDKNVAAYSDFLLDHDGQTNPIMRSALILSLTERFGVGDNDLAAVSQNVIQETWLLPAASAKVWAYKQKPLP